MSSTTAPNTATLALQVARRYKRLNYWREWLSKSGAHSQDAQDKLGTYGLLLSKLVKAANEQEGQATEERLLALERELSNLFESRRLLTDSNGIAAVGEKGDEPAAESESDH